MQLCIERTMWKKKEKKDVCFRLVFFLLFLLGLCGWVRGGGGGADNKGKKGKKMMPTQMKC